MTHEIIEHIKQLNEEGIKFEDIVRIIDKKYNKYAIVSVLVNEVIER